MHTTAWRGRRPCRRTSTSRHSCRGGATVSGRAATARIADNVADVLAAREMIPTLSVNFPSDRNVKFYIWYVKSVKLFWMLVDMLQFDKQQEHHLCQLIVDSRENGERKYRKDHHRKCLHRCAAN